MSRTAWGRVAVATVALLAACSEPHRTPPAAVAATPPTTASTTAAPAPSAAPAPAADAAGSDGPHGTVEQRRFHSDALGVDKDYEVYLPAGYATQPTRRWPVFYYLHGLGGTETDWLRGGHLDAVADKLGLQAIVVMPDGDDGFYVDSPRPIDYDACLRDGTGLFMPMLQPRPRTCVRHHRYETYIVHDLLAEVDGHFRTIADRAGRAIAGLSMGGYGALVLGMRHPDLFAAVASHSGVDALLYDGPHPYVAGHVKLVTDPRTWGAAVGQIGAWVRAIYGSDLATWRAHDPAALAAKLHPGRLAIYLDCGTEDTFALDDEASYLHDVLTAHKLAHAFFLGPGTHNFAFWGARLPASLAFLRDHVSAAAPGQGESP